jgi:hypothetical protein
MSAPQSKALVAEAKFMLDKFEKEHEQTLRTVRACQMVSTVLMKQRNYIEEQIEHGLLLHKVRPLATPAVLMP